MIFVRRCENGGWALSKHKKTPGFIGVLIKGDKPPPPTYDDPAMDKPPQPQPPGADEFRLTFATDAPKATGSIINDQAFVKIAKDAYSIHVLETGLVMGFISRFAPNGPFVLRNERKLWTVAELEAVLTFLRQVNGAAEPARTCSTCTWFERAYTPGVGYGEWTAALHQSPPRCKRLGVNMTPDDGCRLGWTAIPASDGETPR